MGRRKTLRVLIWMFLSVLQRRDRRGRFSSTVTARRDTWLAATAPVSRLPTFATGASTVPTAPTKVAGAVRKNEFFVTHSLSSFFRAVFCIFFFFFSIDRCSKRSGQRVTLRSRRVSFAGLLVFQGREDDSWQLDGVDGATDDSSHVRRRRERGKHRAFLQ